MPNAAQRLSGGELLSAISTAIVQLMRRHYGRGPVRAKTYAMDDLVVCVLRGMGLTPLEQTILDSGADDRFKQIDALRAQFQHLMAERYRGTVEELTGRKVLRCCSHADIESDVSLEVFFLERPLEGFGALELLNGGRATVN